MSVYLQDSDFTLHCGDALEVLRTLPDESVHMCVTSPPFYGLRDYGTGTWEGGDAECDHASAAPSRDSDEDVQRRKAGYEESGRSTGQHGGWEGRAFRGDGQARCKCGATRIDQQIGLEETPEQWVQKLVEVFREVRRVLRRDGTLWLEVGDSYASGGSGWSDTAKTAGTEKASTLAGTNAEETDLPLARPVGARSLFRPGSGRADGIVDSRGQRNRNGVPPVPNAKPKDLIGAPWMLAFALRADGWYLRSDIVWSRPNPMPESVTDRPTKSHSYVFLLSKSARYFFDQEAVREPHSRLWDSTNGGSLRGGSDYTDTAGVRRSGGKSAEGERRQDKYPDPNPAGRNIRSVWNIATQPYPEAHFATYPEELVRRCILAGTSERGCCPECGAPWVREVAINHQRLSGSTGKSAVPGLNPHTQNFANMTARTRKEVTTTGWHPSCQCHGDTWGTPPGDTFSKYMPHDPTPCTVLDPFSGSGTTALVARKHGRKCIGIELSADYCELSARRLQQLSLLSEAGA